MTLPPTLTGVLFALGAGLTWGLVFIAPLWLPEYPAALQSFGRYLAFGLIALPLGWADRRGLRELHAADWREALKLSLVGNIAYYLLLASAIQRSGGPLPTIVIGTLPVVIALVARALATRDRRLAHRARRPTAPVHGRARHVDASAAPPVEPDTVLPWRRLAPSLVAIGAGIAWVNHAELAHFEASGATDLGRYATGGLLAAGAVVCWTWYPIRNGAWLRAHPDQSARVWATAQGLATLPLAGLGYAGFWLWQSTANRPGSDAFPMPFGPRPAVFLLLMFAIGLLASWLGTLCWNEASQRLPPTLAGQLIVFETLAALAYALALRGRWPPVETLVGAGLLVAGVVWAARAAAPPGAGAGGPAS